MQTGYALTRVGAHCVRPLPSQTNFCRGALRAPAKCKIQKTKPAAIRHPERSEVLLRERKRADAKPAQRAGIYEGVFVTFHR